MKYTKKHEKSFSPSLFLGFKNNFGDMHLGYFVVKNNLCTISLSDYKYHAIVRPE